MRVGEVWKMKKHKLIEGWKGTTIEIIERLNNEEWNKGGAEWWRVRSTIDGEDVTAPIETETIVEFYEKVY